MAQNSDRVCELCPESHPALYRCADCEQNMCEIGKNGHLRARVSMHHQISALTEVDPFPPSPSQDPLCSEHFRRFEYFDTRCGHLVCVDCMARDHAAHSFQPIPDAAKACRGEMDGLLVKAGSSAI